MGNLTQAELGIVNLLGQIYDLFYALPELHPNDRSEFVYGIHVLQNLVMARAVLAGHGQGEETCGAPSLREHMGHHLYLEARTEYNLINVVCGKCRCVLYSAPLEQGYQEAEAKMSDAKIRELVTDLKEGLGPHLCGINLATDPEEVLRFFARELGEWRQSINDALSEGGPDDDDTNCTA